MGKVLPCSSDFKLHDAKVVEELEVVEEKSPQIESAALENVVWRKLDMWLLPLCTCFFLLAFLDKTNIGNARVAGMQTSLAISNHQYTVALAITYVPYILADVPSALLLKYVGPNLLLPAMATLWGVVSATQGLVANYPGLLACRLFLGLMEGGLFVGIVLFLSLFYPRKRLQIRMAVFYLSTSLSGAFSGLLAAAIDQMHGIGGKAGWAWILILEGIISFVFGLISFVLLPRSPETARFLTKKEREYVISALKEAGSVSEDDREDDFSWTEVAKAVKSPHVWLLYIVFFSGGTMLYGLAYFEPTIVAGLGYSGNYAQLMSVPPFATAFVFSLVSAFLSDRYQRRGFTVILFSLLELVGFTMFYTSTSSHVRYASLFFTVTGAYCAAPAVFTWLANNSAPHARRATAVAVSSCMSQMGGIVATWLLGALSPAPDYTNATITFMIMAIVKIVLSSVNVAYLWRENRRKATRRQTMNKDEEPKGLGDRSAWFVYSL